MRETLETSIARRHQKLKAELSATTKDRTPSTLKATHGHRMAKARSGMSVDGNLRDLSGRELISPLHFQRGGSSLNFQARRKIWQDQCGGNLLVNFHNALAKKIFNQMEDRSAMTLEKSAYRCELPIDVDLGPAHWKFTTLGGVA